MVHCWHTLHAWQGALCNFVPLLTRIQETFPNKNWSFPKFFNTKKYAHTIQQLGMIAVADTGMKEGYNKGLRKGYRQTNRKHQGLTQQVAGRVEIQEAVNAAAAAAEELTGSAAAAEVVLVGGTAGRGARQRALAGEAAMSSSNGMRFELGLLNKPGTREYRLSTAIPQLDHLVPALRRFFGSGGLPSAVQLQRTMGVLRYEGVADIVRPHPTVFGRCCALELSSVAVNTTTTVEGQEVIRTMYAQVILLLTAKARVPWEEEVAAHNLLLVRWYEPAGADKPLTLQRLRWEGRKRGQRVTTVQGQYGVILAESVLRVVCVAPDFKCKDGSEFFLNDLVHLPDDSAMMYLLPGATLG